MTATDWREDPDWQLVEYDRAYFSQPPTRPTSRAELAQPDTWASQYDGRNVVATWTRVVR